MNYKITSIEGLRLVGQRILTSMAKNDTRDLWYSFKSKLGELNNLSEQKFYSVQIYPEDLDMRSFTPITQFEKWAAIQACESMSVPDGMETLLIPSGKYAVFIHKGTVSTFHKTTTYIFEDWLPKSGFDFDNRPQFEIMDHRYLGPVDQDSEEEVWIPIKKV